MNFPGYFNLVRFRIALLFLCPVISFGQSVKVENGVRYVKNDALNPQNTAGIELRFVKKYGGMDSAIDDVFLSMPKIVVLSADNNLFVLDNAEPYVKVYNSHGVLVKSFGNKGRGPDEFTLPVGMDINSDGELYIAESYNYITVLSLDGNYIRRINTDEPQNLPSFKVTRNGEIICPVAGWLIYYPKGSVYNNSVMRMFDRNGSFIRGFGEIYPYEDQTISRVANAVKISLDSQDNIYLTYRYQNRIEKYSPKGDLVLSISRPLAFSETKNPKAILKVRKNGVVYGVDNPIMNIVSCGIGTDDKGRIWVMTFSRQPKYRRNSVVADGETDYVKLEIFTRDGLLIDKIPLEDDFAPTVNTIYIKGQRLFLINRNDASISEYQIVN